MPAKSTPSTSIKPKKSFLPFLSKAKSVGGEKKGRKEKEVKKLRSHNSMSEELKRIISGNDVSKNEQVPPVPRLQIQGPSPNLGTISPSLPQTSPSMPQYHTVHVPSREFPNMSLSSRTTTATSSTVSSLRSRSRTTTCPSTSSEYSNILPKSHKRPARPPPLPRPDVRTAFHQPDDDPFVKHSRHILRPRSVPATPIIPPAQCSCPPTEQLPQQPVFDSRPYFFDDLVPVHPPSLIPGHLQLALGGGTGRAMEGVQLSPSPARRMSVSSSVYSTDKRPSIAHLVRGCSPDLEPFRSPKTPVKRFLTPTSFSEASSRQSFPSADRVSPVVSPRSLLRRSVPSPSSLPFSARLSGHRSRQRVVSTPTIRQEAKNLWRELEDELGMARCFSDEDNLSPCHSRIQPPQASIKSVQSSLVPSSSRRVKRQSSMYGKQGSLSRKSSSQTTASGISKNTKGSVSVRSRNGSISKSLSSSRKDSLCRSIDGSFARSREDSTGSIFQNLRTEHEMSEACTSLSYLSAVKEQFQSPCREMETQEIDPDDSYIPVLELIAFCNDEQPPINLTVPAAPAPFMCSGSSGISTKSRLSDLSVKSTVSNISVKSRSRIPARKKVPRAFTTTKVSTTPSPQEAPKHLLVQI